MTEQEAFDRALNGIRSQGGPSMRQRESGYVMRCIYRSSDGRKCAVGWLIPDEKYDPDFDDKYSLEDLVDELGLDQGEGAPTLALLRQLQEAHDEAAIKYPNQFMERWEERMKRLAEVHGLSYTPPA